MSDPQLIAQVRKAIEARLWTGGWSRTCAYGWGWDAEDVNAIAQAAVDAVAAFIRGDK